MIDLIITWYAIGLMALSLRPYAANNFNYIMQTLNLYELIGILIFAPAILLVYCIFSIEVFIKEHPIKCPIIWRKP